jgi:hypothetical protein
VFWGSNRGGAGGKEARDDQQTTKGGDGVSELPLGAVDLALAGGVLLAAALVFSALLGRLARQGPVVVTRPPVADRRAGADRRTAEILHGGAERRVMADRRRPGPEPLAPATAVAAAADAGRHPARLATPRRVRRTHALR